MKETFSRQATGGQKYPNVLKFERQWAVQMPTHRWQHTNISNFITVLIKNTFINKGFVTL